MPKSEIKVLLILEHPRIRDIFKSYVCPTQKEQTTFTGKKKEMALVEVGHVSIVDWTSLSSKENGREGYKGQLGYFSRVL